MLDIKLWTIDCQRRGVDKDISKNLFVSVLSTCVSCCKKCAKQAGQAGQARLVSLLTYANIKTIAVA